MHELSNAWASLAADQPLEPLRLTMSVAANERYWHAAGVDLITFGRVVARYEKRGREYVDIEVAVITADAPDQPLWTSWVTFTPIATLGAA